MPELVDEFKKMLECVSALETVACAKVSKGGKPPGTRPKRKKADIEAEEEEARMELDAGVVGLVKQEE